MTTIVAGVIAYLLGSISFAVLVSRAFGLPDPRSYGSKNPGATNVLRSGRRAAAAVTLLGDAAKGWLAVYVAQHLAEPAAANAAMAIAGVAVIVGHIYPVFFRFGGGKGVSTALGVLFGYSYWLAAGAAATWLIIAFFFRISSLAALVAALFAPFFSFLLWGLNELTVSAAVFSALLIARHKANIENLLAGREGRIGERNTG
ncbi:MAG: glycerol-3-phosphate 1-O-acyltransferase PlsY [Betaproteobacteria bacterium]|nr:glycerol-3-phosphate 1-O-acyltransferase PlsY [Betaproteobacteria bacterium]